MAIQENILNYLSTHGKENKYNLARALRTDVADVTSALESLREEGIIEIKEGKAVPLKRKKPAIKKRKQKKQPTEEVKKPVEEEQKETEVSEEVEEAEKPITEEKPSEEVMEGTESKEESEEEQKTDVSEEPTKEAQETFGVKTEEEFTKERVEGTVKFFNPNKGFGFITGDDGEEYYVHKSALKEGVTIEANNRVSFKAVQSDKGPKAEEVDWVSQA